MKNVFVTLFTHKFTVITLCECGACACLYTSGIASLAKTSTRPKRKEKGAT